MRGRVELLIPLSLSLSDLQLLSLLLGLDGGLSSVVSHARVVRLESSLESVDLAGRGVLEEAAKDLVRLTSLL